MNIVAVQIVHYLNRTAESGLDVVRKLLKTYVETGNRKKQVKEDRGNVDVGRIR